ncbi:MAG: glycosyltransferase family 4 protein [Pseudomonadales bacterium]|nr:glycosyltransferase family 4 protein [Pseudomonadales bacterium]
MKVLHVLSSLNVGGAERFAIDLTVEQREGQHITASILSMGSLSEPLELEAQEQNISLIITSKIKELRQAIKNVDIVHVHSAHCLLRILFASLWLPTKIIFTHHNEQINKTLKWKSIHFFASFKISKITFVVKSAEKKFVKVYPYFSNKVVTILNGVPARTTKKTESKKFRLGHVGRFVPLKAQHLLIKAISLLDKKQQNNISLSFYGTGELMQYNQQLAEKLIPHVQVIFYDFVKDRDEIYSNIDCLAVTSETEGLSLAILEAIASGTPTIASNVGGNHELIKDGENGLLYDFENIKKLSKNIEILMTSNLKYERFRSANKKKFLVDCSLEQCAIQYLKVYL